MMKKEAENRAMRAVELFKLSEQKLTTLALVLEKTKDTGISLLKYHGVVEDAIEDYLNTYDTFKDAIKDLNDLDEPTKPDNIYDPSNEF
jgi:hypothetical protein